MMVLQSTAIRSTFFACALMGCVLGTALAADAAGSSAQVLWQVDPTAEPTECHLRLIHEDGALQVRRHEGSLRLSGDTARWRVASDEATPMQIEIKAVEQTAGVDEPVLVEAPTRCRLELETRAGSIEIHDADGPLQAATTTGEILLWVAGEPSLRIELATSGETTVEFGIKIDYRPATEPAKRGLVNIGSAETEVNLSSRQGPVRVLRKR